MVIKVCIPSGSTTMSTSKSQGQNLLILLEVTYKSPLEKLSLSIANTQLLFGVLTAFFAFMFYKCKNSLKIASDIAKPWMEEIQQLREDLSRLRNDVNKSKKQLV